MATGRKIKKVFKSKETVEGAGVHLKRAFGFSEAGLFDPFLLLDDFRSETPEHYRYISGKPLGEPIARYGPIVMNTREELRLAFEEYQNNTFLKHKV